MSDSNEYITIRKEGRKNWLWRVFRGGLVAGGHCATKRDAQSDAEAWIQLNPKKLLLVKSPVIEALADIAYLAGAKRYHSGDSREDIDKFIAWANEFEAANPGEYEDYIGRVMDFTERKLSEPAAVRDAGWKTKP